MFFSASLILFLQKSENITENNKSKEEIDNGCTFEDIDISRTIIEENAKYIEQYNENIVNRYLEISNIELNCLSKDSFNLIKLSSFELNIEFYKVSIVSIFHDQEVKIRSINFDSTVIKQYPNYSPADKLYFQYIPNFILTINLLTFISNTSRQTLTFNNIFDDYTLDYFHSILINEIITIRFTDSFGGIYFKENSITYLPKYFFTSDAFIFNSSLATIGFQENRELTLMHEEAFSDFFRENTSLYFGYCENLRKLLRSIMDLDLRLLDITSTAIEDFEGIDFSGFINLEYLRTDRSHVNPTCEEEKSFKEQYGISENIQIETCT
eukprot:snap_masked-scaffold_1-processed-gene-5.16-mRNA-1 protein AED:1.00 eAED:1.00 QI:0/0/0/0/1/1/2/0/324